MNTVSKKYFVLENGLLKISNIGEERDRLCEALEVAKEALSVVAACDEHRSPNRTHGRVLLDRVKRIENSIVNQSKENKYIAGPAKGNDPDATYSPLRPDMIACEHSWKVYNGLMNSFEYCEKCDEKKAVDVK